MPTAFRTMDTKEATSLEKGKVHKMSAWYGALNATDTRRQALQPCLPTMADETKNKMWVWLIYYTVSSLE